MIKKVLKILPLLLAVIFLNNSEASATNPSQMEMLFTPMVSRLMMLVQMHGQKDGLLKETKERQTQVEGNLYMTSIAVHLGMGANIKRSGKYKKDNLEIIQSKSI